MNYPNFKNKYNKKIIFNPSDLINKKYNLPSKCILLYQNFLFDFIKNKYDTKEIKGILGCKICYTKEFVFVLIQGMGSSHAVFVFEQLIVLGIKEFINIGFAGGIQIEGLFICEKCLKDEGVSLHYAPYTKYAFGNKNLIMKIEKIFKSKKILYIKCINWTIDAPFTETINEIQKYKKEGVYTVDMESSALYTVAKCKKVKIVSILYTSDILKKKWKNLFLENNQKIKNNLKNIINIIISNL